MNKFQTVSFRSIDEFLDYLPEDERAMVDLLRTTILRTIPQVHEKLAYNVPYYSNHRRICFIWPPSVEWGSYRQEGVMLGFSEGYRIADDLNFLDKGNRKQVYTHTYKSLDEIDPDVVTYYVWEAWQIDQLQVKSK
ncbi:MAG: DUF1801 domain-containing protein [Saprospiraceae bacterium]|nr:DUF1801 domain-containing protein [Saprospiraceae bacterium]MCB9320020.1 DUF1801 domain-containing protein [Lewinellaceae bacterium]